MAPRAPPTPRTTRNSRGLRVSTEDAGHTPARTRVARRHRAGPRAPTPPPSAPSPPPSPSSLVLSAPPSPSAPALPAAPVPAFALPPPASPPPTKSLVSALQGRGNVWAALARITPGRTRLQLVLPRPIVGPVILQRPRRHIPGVSPTTKLLQREEREVRLFNTFQEKEGEGFGRELYTALNNSAFLRRCTCHLPNIYDSREDAEAPSARGHFRFYVCGENQDQLGVIVNARDYRDGCNCGRDKVDPIFYNILSGPVLNKNGKRPAEDNELELLAESTEQSQPTEVVRIVPAPVPAPADQTRRRRMSSYLQHKLNRIRTMGNSVLAMFGRSNRNVSAKDTEAVDTRRIDTESNTLTVKRFKRQVCLPANAAGPSVDLKELPYLSWTDDITKYIGADAIRMIYIELRRQLSFIDRGLICGGVSAEVIQENVKANEDLELSIAIHELMRERVGTFTAYDSYDVQADVFKRAKLMYSNGLKSIAHFMEQTYLDPENIAAFHKRMPVPITPMTFGDYEFRNETGQGADFVAWLVRSGRYPKSNDALSKIFMDAKAMHKQELPPSFVYHPGTDDHPLMPGSFPIAVYDEISMDIIANDPVHDIKHPSTEPDPPVKGKDFKVFTQPKGILKQTKEWPQDPASPKYVPTPEKKRKLTFGSPAAIYLPPKNIPNKICSVNQAITQEFLAAMSHGGRSVERADEVLAIGTHKRLGLLSPSNYHPERQFPKSEDAARDLDDRMKLRYHATKYSGLLKDWSFWNPNDRNDEATEAVRQPEPLVGNQTTQTGESDEPVEAAVTDGLARMAVTDEQDRRVTHGLIQDDSDMMEQDINPEIPNVAAGLEKARMDKEALLEKRATPQARHMFLDDLFERDGDDAIPAGSPFGVKLEMSTAKRDEFEIKHQFERELEEAVARQAREKEQRELEEERRKKEELRRRQEEEKQRRKDEERRQQEEQRRKDEEARQREQGELRRAAEARRRKEVAQYAAMTGLRAPSRRIISPLSQDWNEKVAKAGRANPQTELAKMLDGNILRRADFTDRLLPKESWLNDNIVIGAVTYIADYINNAAGVDGKMKPKCSALNSYFWPRLQQHGLNSCARLMRGSGIRKENFLEIDTILIPICQNNHWTLGVVCPARRTVSHVDSMQAGASNPAIANRLLDWVKATLGDLFVENDWNTITYRSPCQTNGYDCGVFTITNAICLALGVDPTEAYSANELTLQRRRIAAILLNGGFKGEFALDGL